MLSHGISPGLQHPSPAMPDGDRAENLSCVRAGTTVSKSLKLGKREAGMGWGGVEWEQYQQGAELEGSK